MRNLLILTCILLVACSYGQGATNDSVNGNPMVIDGVDYSDVSAGFYSVEEIRPKLNNLLDWQTAYRMLETDGVEEFLKAEIKNNADGTSVRTAKALLYMRDGESYKEEVQAGFKHFRDGVENVRKTFVSLRESNLSEEQAREAGGKMLEIMTTIGDYGVYFRACFYHQQKEAVELAMQALQFKDMPDEKTANYADIILYGAGMQIDRFAWNWSWPQTLLEYLKSDNKTLRDLAIKCLERKAWLEIEENKAEYKADKAAFLKKVFDKDRLLKYKQGRLKAIASLKKDAQEERIMLKKREEEETNIAEVKAKYEAATGKDEKKQLALLLDRLEEVDLNNQFGHPYPGRPLNKKFARRDLGMWLYIAMNYFERAHLELIPYNERTPEQHESERVHDRRFFAAKLGMRGEEEAIKEGYEFLNYMNDLLSGKKKEKIHAQLAWMLAFWQPSFNGMANATTDEEYLKWKDWFPKRYAREYRKWGTHLYEEKNLTDFNELPVVKTWSNFMGRYYKVKEFAESYLMPEINKYVVKRQLEDLRAQRDARKIASDEYDVKRKEIENKLYDPEKRKEAIQHAPKLFEEAKAYLEEKSDESFILKDASRQEAPRACAAIVLWNAMLNAKDFEEYITLEREFHRYDTHWPTNKKLVAKYPELYKTYEETLAKLHKRRPELLVPEPKKPRGWQRKK